MTLPTSKNGAHSKHIGMFTLITGSKLCHCRWCFVWVCYIIPGRQLWAVFTIPGTTRTMDVCSIPDPLISCGCLSISVTQWYDEFAGEPSTHSCRVACWKNCCAQKSNKFSAMAIDQCHEQDNGAVKVSARCPKTMALWQSPKWQDRLQHLKRVRWPEDQQPNKTPRIFTMKATWNAICLSQRRPTTHLLFKMCGMLEKCKRPSGSRHQRYHGITCWDCNESENHWQWSIYCKFVDELLSKCVMTVADPSLIHCLLPLIYPCWHGPPLVLPKLGDPVSPFSRSASLIKSLHCLSAQDI